MPPNTSIVVVRGMILAHTVPMALTARSVAINQDMKAIEFDSAIDPVFGFWCLKTLHQRILDEVATAGHGTRRIETSRLGEIPIHTPRGDHQRRFVAIAKEFGQTRDRIETSLSAIRCVALSLSQRAFSGGL